MIDRRPARRAILLAMGMAAIGIPAALIGQPRPKVFQLGYLGAETAGDSAARVAELLAGLRKLGYVEGKDVVMSFRWAEGRYDRLDALASELVRLKVDVLVTDGDKASLAAKRVTTTVPIVVGAVGDAVDLGLVDNLARPGGNITGSTFVAPQLMAKRVALLKETVPRITRMAVLLNPQNAMIGPVSQAAEATARSLKIELREFRTVDAAEIDRAMSAMAREHVHAVIVPTETLFNAHNARIATLAMDYKFPSIGRPEFAEAGGLIGFGANNLEGFGRAAAYADKIFNGVKPGELPFAQPTQFHFVANLKTARALGIVIPQSVLVRADRVIE